MLHELPHHYAFQKVASPKHHGSSPGIPSMKAQCPKFPVICCIIGGLYLVGGNSNIFLLSYLPGKDDPILLILFRWVETTY